jgi:hypothetical protein
MPRDSLRVLATSIAEHELGKPYIWGGDDPIEGFDCSGFVVEVLKSVGLLPPSGDWNAAALYERFRHTATRDPASLTPGMLVFWHRGTPPRIGHVEMVYYRDSDTVLTIGAAGGGATTLTRADAVKQNAYVRIRPIAAGWIGAVDPFVDARP